jgi:catalase
VNRSRVEVQKRQIAYFAKAGEEYGRRVAEKLGVHAGKAMAGATT